MFSVQVFQCLGFMFYGYCDFGFSNLFLLFRYRLDGLIAYGFIQGLGFGVFFKLGFMFRVQGLCFRVLVFLALLFCFYHQGFGIGFSGLGFDFGFRIWGIFDIWFYVQGLGSFSISGLCFRIILFLAFLFCFYYLGFRFYGFMPQDLI